MIELPGMWDESDLRGGEADCADDLLIVRKLEAENAALKEENERLKAEKVQINGKLAGSRLAVSRLKARVAELVSALERINGMDSMSYGRSERVSHDESFYPPATYDSWPLIRLIRG